MKKIFNIKNINRFFLLLVIGIFTTAMFYIASTLFSPEFSIKYFLVGIFFFLVLPVILYYILSKLKLNKWQALIFVVLCIILGCSLRLISISILDTKQVSDFRNGEYLITFWNQYGNFPKHEDTSTISWLQNYYSLFPTWYVYAYIVANIYKIFGLNEIYIKILNVVLYGISAIFLYKGTKNFFDRKIGIITSYFFAVSPMLILYTNISTPDFFSILFITLTLYLWSLVVNEKNIKKKYIYSFCLILSMCMINWFKPLSIYMLLVFLCTEFFHEVCWEQKNKFKQYIKKNYKFLIYFTSAFFIVSFTTNIILNSWIEKQINLSVKNSTSMYLLWGYSLNEEKQYDSNYLYNKYVNDLLEKYNNDYDIVLKEIKDIAVKHIKDNIKYLPRIWNSKMHIAFDDENQYFMFANTGDNYAELSDKYDVKCKILTSSNMFITYFLVICVAMYYLFKDKSNKNVITILLMLMGYIAILILGGVQSRYKALIMPQFCVMTALGTYILFILLQKLLKKIKRSDNSVSINNSTSL